MKNRKALLIIDMQKGSFTPKTPRFDTDGVVKRINEIASIFRERNFPVIYIQHDGTGTGEFEKNSSDWENLDELIVEPTDFRIDKYANDVFYESQLQSKLTELNVTELFITGCATDFCFLCTQRRYSQYPSGRCMQLKQRKINDKKNKNYDLITFIFINWIWTRITKRKIRKPYSN